MKEDIKIIKESYVMSTKHKLDENNKRLKQAIESVLKELDKKDKVIDLMARSINNNDIDDDMFGRFGKYKDCSDFADEELCVDCIKEYFYKKVEGEYEQ